MASLDHEVKDIIIRGVARSENKKDSRFELPLTVRMPVDCKIIDLAWTFSEKKEETE